MGRPARWRELTDEARWLVACLDVVRVAGLVFGACRGGFGYAVGLAVAAAAFGLECRLRTRPAWRR